MNIVIDSCAYTCQNVGDIAMLMVAVARLRGLWPSASIHVITSAPQLVGRYCPGVTSVPLRGRRLVLHDRLLGRFERMLPARVGTGWSIVERRFRSRHSALLKISLRVKGALTGRDASDAAVFLSAIDTADLMVVSGAGVLTDAFTENAMGVLATLDMAVHRGIPTAMFGQGLGPLHGAELRSHAADVLPRVSLIAVRERLVSAPLLVSLGVSPDRVLVTGDDAIEMAMPAAGADAVLPQTNRSIGVNVRVAHYADVDREHLDILRKVLGEESRVRAAKLSPIPIAHRDQMDVAALRDLLAGMTVDDVDGGASLDTPQRVIDRIRQCRLVVTGSYHAAVFALAQGIPVIALASSEYYLGKMAGIADQFGDGCRVVTLAPPSLLASRTTAAIDRLWEDADRLRPTLLASAARQVAAGHAAYARLQGIVESSAVG